MTAKVFNIIKLSKEELNQWLKEVEFYDTGCRDHDSCDNDWETKIYQKDGKLFSLDFCNNEPCHEPKRAEAPAVYRLYEVKKIEETIIVTKYKRVDKKEAKDEHKG